MKRCIHCLVAWLVRIYGNRCPHCGELGSEVPPETVE